METETLSLFLGGESFPVVLDADADVGLIMIQGNQNIPGAGMFNRVCDRFLRDAVQVEGHRVIADIRPARRLHMAFDAGVLTSRRRQVAQGILKAGSC